MSKIIVANLKMNHTYEDIIKYKRVISECMVEDLIICPSFIHLEVMRSNDYILGAQDGYYVDKGAYTGQVSFYQLQSMGVKYSLIDHSDIRKVYEETNETINNKIKSCLKHNIIPIVCIGESSEERNNGEAQDVIGKKLREILQDVKVDSIIIAYEPIWAIGSGVQPTSAEIEEVHIYIKKVIKDIYNMESKVLYGGSVNEKNVEGIINVNGVDGVLIGTAAIDPNSLIRTINKINL